MVENIRYNTFVRRQEILGTYYRRKKLFSSNELKSPRNTFFITKGYLGHLSEVTSYKIYTSDSKHRQISWMRTVNRCDQVF